MSTAHQRSKSLTGSTALLAFVALLVLAPNQASAGQPDADPRVNDAYFGNYRVSPDHLLGIDRFTSDSGESLALISDYQSGIVRRLFPVSDTEFVMGPGFGVQSPVELRVRFLSDERGNITGVSLQPASGAETVATRVPLKEEDVVFNDGPVRLAGKLIMPATRGPHPAIILLHGSGPLTRYSFGPYPYFFTSLGMAVLIYDKRGTGASTGTLLDASSGAPMQLPASYYPVDLTNDALAAFRFLQGRKDINHREIGVWGSSEGGMLTTQVAARSKDVAFAINSSGFMGPLWQTGLYQVGAMLKEGGSSAAEIYQAVAFTRLGLGVGETGEDYDLFLEKRHEAIINKKTWVKGKKPDSSLEQMRWDWDHVWAFSPLPALKKVTCPVLGVFGELDTSTSAADAVENMRRVLSESGNKDFTLRIFPNAEHSLAEMPSRSRMAPGVFETLRSWLLKRIHSAVPVGRADGAPVAQTAR
jgi:pimeloyl-ACP methyl ester carboxylesterase